MRESLVLDEVLGTKNIFTSNFSEDISSREQELHKILKLQLNQVPEDEHVSKGPPNTYTHTHT